MNVALIRKLRRSLVLLPYFIDVLATGDFTNRHWQTSGRLVQKKTQVIHRWFYKQALADVRSTCEKKQVIHRWFYKQALADVRSTCEKKQVIHRWFYKQALADVRSTCEKKQVIHRWFYKQALVDVRSTCARIKCLHCICTYLLHSYHQCVLQFWSSLSYWLTHLELQCPTVLGSVEYRLWWCCLGPNSWKQWNTLLSL